MIKTRLALVPFLLLLTAFQSPQDEIRRHYEAAEAKRRDGNLAAAESEYLEILREASARLGKIYLAEKQYTKAIAALEGTSALQSNSDEMVIDLAIAYFNAEQFDKALQAAQAVLSRNPQSVGARHMAGKSHFMLGEFAKAATELETARNLAPKDYDITYTLALAYLKQHQSAPAKNIFDRMLIELGDRPQLRILFGRAYRETDFLPEAIAEFKRAVALDPHFPRAHYYLGLTYLLKDGAAKLGEAGDEFRVELASNPNEFFANYYLGIVSLLERKSADAVRLLEKASQIEPNNPDPYFHLGQAYVLTDQPERAITALRRAIELNPYLSHNDYQVTTAHFRLGQALIKLGRSDEGQRELQMAAELKSKAKKRDEEKAAFFLSNANLHDRSGKFPEMHLVEGVVAESSVPDEKTSGDLKTSEEYYAKVLASAYNNIGLLRAQQLDFRGAAQQFVLAANWNPQLEQINFNQGLAFFKAELYKEAVSPLENELRLNATNTAAKQLLGLSYFMLEQYEKVLPLLREVVAANTNDVGVYYALAFSLLKQDQKELAEQTIQQMVAFSGNTPQLHVLLSQALYQQNDTAKALQELKTAQTLDPKFRLVHYYAGLIFLKLGQFDNAAQEFENELAISPDDVRSKYHLAFVLLANQKTDRGVALMKEVIASKPDYAEAYYELGKALLSQGDSKGAVNQLETALKLQPDRSYVHYQLGRAYLAQGRKSEGENQLEIARQLKEKEREQTKP